MLIAARNGVIREWLQKGKMPSGFEQEIREMFDILGTEDSLSYQEVIAASEKKEIYTYTPKGDRICLPRGSLVLDFAFKVHTEVGSHCIGAMVGETRVDQEYVLRDGDRVRILLSEKPVRFDPRIQQLCQSPKARSEIARLLRMRVENLANQAGDLDPRAGTSALRHPVVGARAARVRAYPQFFPTVFQERDVPADRHGQVAAGRTCL